MSGAGGAGNWAIQQLLAQQLAQQAGGALAGSGTSRAPAASATVTSAAGAGSSQQDAGYAARMMAGRLTYPCHGCGVTGHWKGDGTCNPTDVAAYIKKKAAEKKAEEAAAGKATETTDSGKILYLCMIS